MTNNKGNMTKEYICENFVEVTMPYQKTISPFT